MCIYVYLLSNVCEYWHVYIYMCIGMYVCIRTHMCIYVYLLSNVREYGMCIYICV